MARLDIGGKYGNQIVFQGHKKYLPVTIRGIINAYFSPWNTLKDITTFTCLMEELGQAGAQRHFKDTDWEKLHGFYLEQLEKSKVVFSGAKRDGKPVFRALAQADNSPRSIQGLLMDFTGGEGVLSNSFDIWRLEKLLRRANAKIVMEGSFGAALKEFAKQAISFEESVSFLRQIQAYHSAKFLAPELEEILSDAVDRVHTLNDPLELAGLVSKLKQAGASIRLHSSVEPVLIHFEKLRKAALPKEQGQGTNGCVDKLLVGKLKTELYPFQREGVAFLTVNRRALLADDMGLGKTLQAVAAGLCLKQQIGLKRVLIICPASLKYQWQAEIHRFTSERCEVIGGDKKERGSIYSAAKSEGGFIAPEDRPMFFVVNFELVHRDLDLLKGLKPDLLIVDEAQRIKNFRTKTNKAVIQIPAPCMFVLTGTPLENQLMELYTIMRIIDDRALGKNPVAFRDRYVITDRFGGITGYRLVEEVTRKIASLTLRRTKQQALSQLPPIIEQPRWLELTDVQRRIYKELRGHVREMLSDDSWDKVKANNAMTLVQRLREVCDSPELIDPEYTESQKLTELLTIVEDEVVALDRQVIIFTQWTRMGEIIERELKKAGYELVYLHGGVNAKARQQMVEGFQAGEHRIFLSTDAGGVGLNLQSASLVVNFDLPFNPAKLNQRIGRAHRIGQENTVIVVNLLCRNTIEHRLMQVLKEKQALFDSVFGDISDRDEMAAKPASGSLRELLNELLQ